ncbi:uncharacterized protein [Physcomitrium patens]|uniref:uncharacterized protein isoform X2 n=1 Tax=Physcomitrium patens TaxID=3218 RepID=UPI000D1531E4|nr:pentatricopeptide repeat-containing protein At2g18940, chloroplastic-like isoform X2 [Physcomitrium patens]|eukprot:XP_024377990.1 pentatricopeptide repeat-containing protein At2g18940, chloroplastic-like isoform X2 [Physcomitrella patens]
MAGLPVASSLVAPHIDCSSTASLSSKDVKCTGLAWAAMEPCAGSLLPVRSSAASPGIRTPVGLGRTAGLNDIIFRRSNYGRNEEKSGRVTEIVQQFTPSPSSLPEGNPKPCQNPLRSWGSRAAFTIVQATSSSDYLEDDSQLNSVKDYNSALLNCVKDGRMRDAMTIFKRFEGAGLKPDVVSYTALIQGFGKLKSYNKVTDVFSRMQRNRCPPDLKLCTVLISTYGNGGLPVLAESAMQYAQAQGLQPDAIAYTALVHAYAQEGLWEEAEKTLSDMLDVGIVDDRPYAALVAAYGKAGLTDNVNKILETMKASGVEASTTLYNTLINIHSKAEAPEKARAVLQLMQADGCQCDEITYTSVMEAYSRNKQPLMAESMMGEMKRAGIQPGPVSYGVLISAYCRAGRLGDAERILRGCFTAGLCKMPSANRRWRSTI